jgi:hypothetical protein
MKKIGQYIDFQKNKLRKKTIDEKTIFFLFNKIVKEMYGEKGIENLKAEKYASQTVFFSAKLALWAADVLVNRQEIINKINGQIGSSEVKEIKNYQ